MSSRVVLVTRLRSSLGVAGDHDGLTVADIRHPDAVETTIAAVHRSGDLPIVTCSTDDLEEVRRLITYTMVRYPGLRACLEPIEGHSTAVGIVSSIVDDINADEDALAWRLSALDHLRTSTWSAVWLPKVTGLKSPAPSLWQHARSWFPGAGFLAVDGHPGSVRSARQAPLTGIDARPGSAVLHSPVTADTWVLDAVKAALQPQSVSPVTTVREQVDVYGTDRAIELVAVPTAFHADSKPDPASIIECPACSLRHARPACPSCKMAPDGAAPLVLEGEAP